MSLTDITLFSLMKNKMEYLSERQAVLAQNVANIDTPGFQAHDIEKPNFDALVNPLMNKIQMRLTSPMHKQGGSDKGPTYKEITRDSTYELNFNKNNITLEEEMKKLSETQTDYQTVTNLYRKTTEMFKTALGRNGAA